jgi:phosphoglycolate phosphatase-like HAD superfamily hydrolase
LLVLWDIDHTLIQTGGVGTEVFAAAFKTATGVDLVEAPDPTGKLERGLFTAACAENGIGDGTMLFPAFAEAQEQEYRRRAADLTVRGRVLPGVPEVLNALSDRHGVTQTVLSGNTPSSGRAKLEIFGLADYIDFTSAAWGTDADTRPELVTAAWNRAHATYAHSFGPADTVVIGDTPADVETALTNRCRLVAVATGKTTAAELRKAGAETVLPDLSDKQAALAAILGSGHAAV